MSANLKTQMSNVKTEASLTQVTKRDGRVVAFDPSRIVRAIGKAVAESKEFGEAETKRLAEIVVNIMVKSKNHHIPSVEEVQDVVEQVLMAAGHYQTAKRYILYREERRKERSVRSVMGVVDDLGLSLNQLKVIERRYLLHDEEGKVIETPKKWLVRVAKTLAAVEKRKKDWQAKFYEVMANFEFLPAGRTLNNAGTAQNQLANCFVLPVEDSMEGIFEAVKWTALVHQAGGGSGFNFSHLRPMGDVITKSAGGFATGPVSFMKVFDVATRQVMQGGKKRGANMGILNVDHPDVMEFMACKTEEGEIANFNISVGISDEFMKAVERDKEFGLKSPRTGVVIQQVRARTLFDQMATLAWRTGDPGVVFLDAINKNNPLAEKFGAIEATNPCGEQPLHAFDACNLGSLNLAKFVNLNVKTQNAKLKTKELIKWERLAEVVRIAVRMLDNVIDVGKYPLPQITKTVKANRRIGLGVMGWAQMLFALGIAYDSEEGVKLAKKVMSFIQRESWEASRELAEEKGVFPRWSESDFVKKKDRVRNVAITTIAPTGTISMVAETSSGIEPVFALSYVKNVVDEGGLTYTDPYFMKAVKGQVTSNKEQVIFRAVAREGGCRRVEGIPDKIRRVFVTAHDVSWQWHVKMQAAFQEFCDNAVSKTINLPKGAGIEDIKQVYLAAWKAGCKGITVYRDQSKEFQVLATNQKEQAVSRKDNYLIQSKLKIKTLGERIKEGLVPHDHRTKVCPECGGEVALEEGCSLCHACGWSACSS